nr:hypothetical protein [Tanacetum cinerariifolium]
RVNKVNVLKLRRLKKVETSQRIESSADTDMEDASNQGRMIVDLDRDTGVALMDDEGTKRKQKMLRKGVVIRDPEEESTAIIPAETKSKDKGKGIMVEEPNPMKKKQQVELDEELDYFKGMSYDDMRLIFKAKFNSNIEFLLKSKEQIEEEENRAIESINETPALKAAKRRKLNEEVE